MLFSKDDIESRKLVTFYAVSTSAYFSFLILVLFWTDGFYNAGNYKFNAVILFVVISELCKYFSSVVYNKTHDVNLSRKYDDKSTNAIIKNLFTKTKIKEGFKNVILVAFMVVIFANVAILYGAEVFSKYEETFMFSSLLSVLTVLPACVNLGSQSLVSLILGGKPIGLMETLIYQNFYLTMFGAWLGAFVIPLDWERPWQVWPIPCSLGAMIGFTLSHFLMLFKVKTGNKKKSKRVV